MSDIRSNPAFGTSGFALTDILGVRPLRPTFRPYQAGVVHAAVDEHRRGQNPVVSVPTGGGKSLIAAGIVEALSIKGDERIVVTVPSRELATQNEAALALLLPADQIGVCCASLGRREIDRRIVVGTPQSLVASIDFDPTVVVVDECHLMPLHRGSWFERLFNKLPRGKATPRIGMSATTFRKADGRVYGGKKAWFTSQPAEVTVQDLVAGGWLAPVRYVHPAIAMRTAGVARNAGGFNQAQLTAANLDLVSAQAATFVQHFTEGTRKRGMLFAVGVDHAQAFMAELRALGEDPALIIGAMKAEDRRDQVADFKAERRRIAVTVSAGLTGLDVPEIDLIASCRPTLSPIIHVQSIGRGTRPAEGKRDLLVLDFAENIPLFGPVHAPNFDKAGQPRGTVAPWRPCPDCGTYAHYETAKCVECGTALTLMRVTTASDLEFGQIAFRVESEAIDRLTQRNGTSGLPVQAIQLHGYRKQSDPRKVSCMVSFALGGDAIVRMWVRDFSTRYWRRIWTMLLGELHPPASLEEAYARRAELVRPASIDIERDGSFWRVRDAHYADDEPEVPQSAMERNRPVPRISADAGVPW